MKEILFLSSVASLYFVLAISPGPNFLVITMTAASESRRQAIYTALGVSSASIIWASLAAAGLGIVLAHFGWAQRILQMGGGIYLIYMGIRIFWNAHKPISQPLGGIPQRTRMQAYYHGLATNVTNPKSLVFFSSAFATLFSPILATWAKLAAVIVVAVISIGWNVLVATVFSHRHTQNGYRRAKPWIDRITGGLIGIFGLKLVLNR